MARRRAPAPVQPTPEDSALFRSAIGEVRELAPAAPPPETPRPAPLPRQRDLDEADALEQSQLRPFDLPGGTLGETAEHLQAGLDPRVLKRLRRGQYSVQDELVMHGLSAAAAPAILRRFLRECRADGRLCVRIVHGKGLRSGLEGPVLKGLAEHLLRQRSDVLAYASAPEAQGGTGALLVLLARPRPGGATAGADDLT
jgi:DNA-nicking Smr family endonuclease